MGRSHTEPIQYSSAVPGAPSRPPLNQHQASSYALDPYYDQLQDTTYGGYNQDDARSVYSHTALNIGPENPAVPSLPPQPPQPQHYGYPPHQGPHSPFVDGFSNGHHGGGGPMSPPVAPSFYNQAREQVMRRREQAKVELVDGHLRLDLPVPRSLKQIISFKGQDMREESGKMR